jgi:hypothetical protein
MDFLNPLVEGGGTVDWSSQSLSKLPDANYPSAHVDFLDLSGNPFFDFDNSLYIELTGLSSITSAGTIKLGQRGFNSTSIQNINTLSNLSTVDNISIYQAQWLQNIDAFSNITTVSGNIFMDDNFRLENLNGFSNLTYVGGYLSLEKADYSTLQPLSNLTYIGGEFEVGQTNITNLDGLENLTYIGGPFRTYKWSDTINDISGISNLTHVGSFSLTDKITLFDISPLANLATITDYVDFVTDTSHIYNPKIPAASDFCQGVNGGSITINVAYSRVCE